MQIVIDIPEDIIESAKSSPNYYPFCHFEKIWKAIVNGTPLPKGHGRLKDADKFNYNSDNYITKHGVESTPTIIEADSEPCDDYDVSYCEQRDCVECEYFKR